MRKSLLLFLLLSCFGQIASAVVWPVSPAGQIQTAIDGAADGDTVLLASGTFQGTGNENLNFNGRKILLTSSSGAALTVIRTTSAVRSITFNHHEDSSSVVDGVTFSGGYEGLLGQSYRGGILLDSASPVIRNCVISGSYALHGGGMEHRAGSKLQLQNCSISYNYAVIGAGIYAANDTIVIHGSTIKGNRAFGDPTGRSGGGMYLANCQAWITSSTIAQNKGSFVDSVGYGGGLFVDSLSRVALDSSSLAQNFSPNGGALYSQGTSVHLQRSIVYNNTAQRCAGVLLNISGGGSADTNSVAHCTFVCNYGSESEADGVRIVDSSVSATTRGQAQIRPHVVIYSNIFAFNSSAAIGSTALGFAPYVEFNDVWMTVTGPRYSGTLGDLTGTMGNFAADPLLCDISTHGCGLDAQSPCVGVGEAGATVGARPVTCNMYTAGLPHQVSVYSDTADYFVGMDNLKTAVQQARPWDTLFLPSEHYWGDLPALAVSKPLYILGRGADSTEILSFAPSDVPSTAIHFTSFGVVQSVYVNLGGCCTNYISQGIVCDSSSPIILDSRIEGGNHQGSAQSLKSVILDPSSLPLIRRSHFKNPGQLTLTLYTPLPVVVSQNYWGTTNLDSISACFANYIFSSEHAYVFTPILTDNPTGVETDNTRTLPDRFTLGQNFPNPFNPSTVIPFSLPRRAHVTLSVFNVLGQEVVRLVDRDEPAGAHQVIWDSHNGAGRTVASGVYLYRLTAGTTVQTRKMLLIK
jgi:hypothetical protein